MLYVHVAEAHVRELLEAICEAALCSADPDVRIIAMLTPEQTSAADDAAKRRSPKTKTQPFRLRRSCAKGDSNPVKTSHQLLESRGLAIVFIG